MATKEERLSILRMIANGTVTAEEGAHLISALGRTKPRGHQHDNVFDTSRNLQIRVSALSGSSPRISASIPVGLINLAVQWLPREAHIDLSDLQSAINAGVRGHLAEIIVHEENIRIEILLS